MPIPHLSDEQRAKWAERLSRRVDRSDSGQLLPLTAEALSVCDPVERLCAVGRAFASEKVIVPINVERHPDADGEHHYIDPSSADAPQMRAVDVDGHRGIAVFSSADELRACDPDARPLRVGFRKVALAALVETAGCVILNPHHEATLMPRPLVAALAQGDQWLPAWGDAELLAELNAIIRQAGDDRIRAVRVRPEDKGTTVCLDVVCQVGHYTPEDRHAMMVIFEALRASGRLQASASRVTIVPVME